MKQRAKETIATKNNKKNNLKNGNKAFQSGQYHAAIEYYKAAKEESPELASSIEHNIKLAIYRIEKKESLNISKQNKNHNKSQLAENKEILKSSKLFDEDFYLKENPDLINCESLLEHYLLFGGFEGRAASKNFDSKKYIKKHPEIIQENINPLIHYLKKDYQDPEEYNLPISAPQEKTQHSTPDEILLIQESNLFDKKYYTEKYPDVAYSNLSPEEHFLKFGGLEGREASRNFSCAAYLDAYEDVKISGMNPLIHYLRFGQKEKRVAFESELEISGFLNATRSKKTVILDNLPDPAAIDYKRYRCALLVHAFYFDVFQEILSLAKNLPLSKIIVTTTEENYDRICTLLAEQWHSNYRVSIIQENKGRDIAPFLNENIDNLFDFDFVCKIHTKKSPHLDSFGNKWKRHLIENLIGSPFIFERIISLFIHDPKLGIAYPEPMNGTNNCDWAENKNLGIGIFERLGIDVSETELEQLDYPPATMFWFRPPALKKLFNSYNYSEFPKEPIHFDGTLAHALERTFNYVCRKSGYNNLEYVSLTTLTDTEFKESVIFDWLNSNKNREKFIIVSHEASNTGAPKTALSILKALRARDKSCLTILLNGGEQEPLFSEYGAVINYNGQPLRESLLKIVLENKEIKVICNTVVSYQAARFFQSINLPVISLVHEFISSGHFSEDMFSTLIENSDQIIYPAEFVLQDTLNNISVDSRKIEIMPQGIYNDDFPIGNRTECRRSLINELGVSKDAFIVLGCGTVEARKGVDILVQVAKHVLSTIKTKDIHFVWVGKATEQDNFYIDCLREISSSKLLKNNFHFMGAHTKVDHFFLAADLFVLPSRYDPFPGVVLEAMAADLPIVCFDGTTGVHEAFEDNIGGFICKHLDHLDMANKIVALYENQELTRTMGARNQAKVRQRYNFGKYTDRILEKFCEMKQKKTSETKFSIVVPVYNTPPNYLQKMIQSALCQTYKNLELCIADGSSSDLTKTIINYYAALDPRIKSQKVENKGIAENTNSAISMASGEYICFLDHDDVLPKNALQDIYDCIKNNSPDVIYTNEDKIDENGLKYFSPVTKPEFSIKLLEEYNYITHLLTIKRKFFDEKIVRIEPSYDGAQDYDLVLRCAENTKNIHHIPKILYHWRVFENSTSKGTSSSKSYAVDAGKRALEAHLNRTGRIAQVSLGNRDFRYIIEEAKEEV